MTKRIPYKTVSEKLQSKLQTMHYNYESIKKEVTILKNKLIIYEPYMDIIIKYDMLDTNMLEDKLKKQIDVNSHNEKINVHNNVDILTELEIKNNASKNIETDKNTFINDNFINNDEDISTNISSYNIDNISNNIENDGSKIAFKNKIKVSDSIIERIEKFYNNYKEDKFKINENDTEIDNIKDSINNNYNTINLNKSQIIYNSYLLYQKYLEAKKENKDLLFVNFISENKDINRYSEKAKRCYNFFNELLNITADIQEKQNKTKINIILDILAKCRLSLDKLYKIRNDNYHILIDFLTPILVEECKIKD